MGSGGGQYLVDAATFLIEQKEMLFNILWKYNAIFGQRRGKK